MTIHLCHEGVCDSSNRCSWPVPQCEKHVNAAQNMYYIPWRVILCYRNVKKVYFEIFGLELFKVKSCISRLCTRPFRHVSHYWWKQSFRVFGGVDLPSARLQTAKNVLWYPSWHILS